MPEVHGTDFLIDVGLIRDQLVNILIAARDTVSPSSFSWVYDP